MFIKAPQICEQALWQILALEPEGIQEFDLIKRLQAPPYCCLDHTDLVQPIRLFQTHFALFHFLYQMRNHWLDLEKGCLEIVSTHIRLLPYQAHQSSIELHDPLVDYYLDWQNYTNTSSEDVELMLDQFWKRFDDYYTAPAPLSDEDYRSACKLMDVSVPFSLAELKQQYRKLMHHHHPDKGGQLEQCQAIEHAYRQLKQSMTLD